jgi:competence protein ComEA
MLRRLATLTMLAALALPCAALDVNTASQAELEMLKGVGPQLSEAILTARRERPFRDWPDLMARLKGVGPVRAGKLSAAGLTVGEQAWAPATTDSASSSAPALKP